MLPLPGNAGIVSTLILIAGYASTCSSTILPARISAGHLRMLFTRAQSRLFSAVSNTSGLPTLGTG